MVSGKDIQAFIYKLCRAHEIIYRAYMYEILSRAHVIICRAQEIICRAYDIICLAHDIIFSTKKFACPKYTTV